MLFDKHYDLDNDKKCDFSYFLARGLDVFGAEEVINRIVKTVGDEYVYTSMYIAVLNPGKASTCWL